MSKIAAGKRDRRITLERLVSEKIDGTPKDSWKPIATVWAAKNELKGYERFQNDRNVADAEVEFVILYSGDVKDLSTADRVTYGDAKYDIIAVAEIGRKDGLSIKAKRRDVANA